MGFKFPALTVILALAVGLSLSLVPGLTGSVAVARDEGGVSVGNPSFVRKMVSAENVEKAGGMEYARLLEGAKQKGVLLRAGDPQVERVRKIAKEILPYSYRFNERAEGWDWEVNVFRSNTINAFCMPGGKIAIYTGILDRLALNDDEVAMIIGHEVAHALREHARERMAKSLLTNFGAVALGWFIGSDIATNVARMGGNLLTLKFSRDDETEADLIGMEMAARAGYDPRAGVTLWQKMSKAAKGQPMEFMSTHPSGETRIAKIEASLPDVMPLYEAARKAAN